MLYSLRKEILVAQVDTVAVREKFVSVTSRIRGVDETCECEKITTSSVIYKNKDKKDQVISYSS